MCISRYAQGTQNRKFAYQKNVRDEVDFLLVDKRENFLQVDSTQKNKFAIYLQYLKGNVKDEVDFLPADKRQRCLQNDTIILGLCGQTCPDCSK